MMIELLSGRLLVREKGRPQRVVEVGADNGRGLSLYERILNLEEIPEGYSLARVVRELEHQDRLALKETVIGNYREMSQALATKFNITEGEANQAILNLVRKTVGQ